MKREVKSPYECAYADPLRLEAGENVQVEGKPTEWEGWIWCTNSKGKAGWAPCTYLNIQGNQATAIRDYVAAELTVKLGDILDIQLIESGWAWCDREDCSSGWVPLEVFETSPKL